MTSLVEKLLAHWRSQGIYLSQGNTIDQLNEFEAKFHISFPYDMRNYFLQVDGLRENWPHSRDKEGFSFWPLNEVRSASEEAANHDFHFLDFPDAISLFIFADYLDWSWAYAILLSENPDSENSIFIVGQDPLPKKVAASFSDFIKLYLVDSSKLYGKDG